MVEFVWCNAEKIGALAQVGIVTAGLLAILVALAQMKNARRQQCEATAYSVYSEQLKLDLLYPHFSHPNLAKLKSSNMAGQYDDYIWHMLYSCENILDASTAVEWRQAIKYGFRPHAVYFRDHVLHHKDTLSSEVVQLMQDVVAELKAP